MTTTAILIENAALVATMNDAGDELRGVAVAIVGNRIAAVGSLAEAQAALPPGAAVRRIDAAGMLLLPGFTNCHHHLFQTLTRAVPRMQDAELFDWLTNLYEIWREFTPEYVYVAALVGLGELLLTGCTTTTDHTYLFPAKSDGRIIDAEIRAARDLGIRFHPTRGCMSKGRSQGGLPPDDVCQHHDAIMADSERLIAEYHDPAADAMLKIGLAPCAPFNVEERTMVEMAQLARQHGLRLHTHMAETRDEEIYCAEHFGMRPIDWAEKVGWLGPDVWWAHVVHINDDEIARLAASGTGVCHCPASNMRLGSGISPVPKMIAAGVRVGLGVDGSSSNDTGDLWGEVRNTMLVHRLLGGASALDARTCLRLGTRGGAEVLGYEQGGRIEVGALADVILINLQRIGFAGASVHDPLASIVFCGDSHIVDYNIVNGAVVVENGRLTQAREKDIVAKANDAAQELVRRAQKNTGIPFLEKMPGRA